MNELIRRGMIEALQRFVLDLATGDLPMTQSSMEEKLKQKYNLENLLKFVPEEFHEAIREAQYPYVAAYLLARMYLMAQRIVPHIAKNETVMLSVKLPVEVAEMISDYLEDRVADLPASALRLYSYLKDVLPLAKKLDAYSVTLDPDMCTGLLLSLSGEHGED